MSRGSAGRAFSAGDGLDATVGETAVRGGDVSGVCVISVIDTFGELSLPRRVDVVESTWGLSGDGFTSAVGSMEASRLCMNFPR